MLGKHDRTVNLTKFDRGKTGMHPVKKSVDSVNNRINIMEYPQLWKLIYVKWLKNFQLFVEKWRILPQLTVARICVNISKK